ncbi:MAG: tetratricopeptide repeat protein [Acidobacteriaceae bacterium]
MKPKFVACATLLLGCCAAWPQRTHNPDQSPTTEQKPVERQPDPVAFEGVQSSLEAGRKDEALQKAQAIVSIYPNNTHANTMAGAVLLEMARPADAVAYFRKVVEAQPDDPHAHSLLLEAYAESGDKDHRDQERAILRRFHADGKHPAFAEAHGYMIERIPVGNLTVAAIEYFAPEGRYHFAYRFDVYDTSDKMIEFIALANEDEDQALFAQSHPKEAKAGSRRYSLDRYTQNQQALLGFIDGTPSYDELRARVVKVVTAETDTAADKN